MMGINGAPPLYRPQYRHPRDLFCARSYSRLPPCWSCRFLLGVSSGIWLAVVVAEALWRLPFSSTKKKRYHCLKKASSGSLFRSHTAVSPLCISLSLPCAVFLAPAPRMGFLGCGPDGQGIFHTRRNLRIDLAAYDPLSPKMRRSA